MASPGCGTLVQEWLEKYIIMEDITLLNLSSTMTISCLAGPKAISRILSNAPAGLIADSVSAIDWSQLVSQIALIPPDPGPAGLTYLVGEHGLLEREVLPWLASLGVVMLPSEVFAAHRILNGIVMPGVDASENENPLESPLRDHVSFSKGCYIGQEVIARIDTYKKLQRALRPLVIEGPTESCLSAGKLYQGGTEVGYTTTHARYPGPWRQIAMGYIRIGVDTGSLEYLDPTDGSRHSAYVPKDATW